MKKSALICAIVVCVFGMMAQQRMVAGLLCYSFPPPKAWYRLMIPCILSNRSFASVSSACNRLWRNDNTAASCCALAMRKLAMLRPRLNNGCVSDPIALSNQLPGLMIAAPLLLVHPAEPPSVMLG